MSTIKAPNITSLKSTSLLIGLFIPFSQAYASRVETKSINIDVYVNRDGSLDIVDNRRIFFEKETTEFTYQVPLTPASNISDFILRQDDQLYQEIDGNQENINSYQVLSNKNELAVEYYFWAKDQTKKFTFNYHVNGATSRYQDTALVEWFFLDKNTASITNQININFYLPDLAESEQIQAWIRGAFDYDLNIESGQNIHFYTNQLDPKYHLQAKVTFPSSFILGDIIPQTILSELIEQEENFQTEYTTQRQSQQVQQKKLKSFPDFQSQDSDTGNSAVSSDMMI